MGKGINTNHFRGQGGGVGSQRSPLMRSWHQHVFGTQLGLFYWFWSSTKNNTKKLMSKMQLGKLQPIQLILPHVLTAPWEVSERIGGHWEIWHRNCKWQDVTQTFSLPYRPHTSVSKEKARQTPALHMHTHILLNMFKHLQRLISDFIFSSSPGLARSLPSIIYAFALMNY